MSCEEHENVGAGRTWQQASDKSLRTARHVDRMRGRNRKKPSYETPTLQWEKLGVDLFSWEGRDYQVIVDYTSNFWEVDRMNTTTTTSVIKQLKSHVARFGIPSLVISNNGAQYVLEKFRPFAAKWDFEHQTSASGHRNAYGKAEPAVKATRLMISKCKKSQTSCSVRDQEYTYTRSGSSPEQRLLNRRTRTLLPMPSKLLAPRGEEYLNQDKISLMDLQHKQAKHYNKTTKDLSVLADGDVVRMKPFRQGQKEWEKAVVQRRLDERSYKVDTPQGTYRRNRVHLRRTRETETTVPLVPVVSHDTNSTAMNETVIDSEPVIIRLSTRLKKRPARLEDYVHK